MAQTAYKRRQYIVNKKMQFKYVGIFLLFLLLNFSVCVAIVYHTGWTYLVAKLANVYPQGRLVSILNLLRWRMLFGFILVMPFAVITALMFSHRIAGPVVRIKKSLRMIGEGNFDFVIKLRKNDELKDIADEINKLVKKLKARFSKNT